jgi:serpin B
MPTWSVTAQAPLRDLLSGLGMPLAFTDAADFSGMTTDVPLEVADVLHQAVVRVDQHGTEAAAATAVVMGATSAVAPPPVTVVVDRPYLYVIHDLERATPLFVGRVVDPRS